MSPKTATVPELLAKRYPAPEYALMLEVAPRTGGGTRYADAVAVGLWQSRGHVVHGFEIKVSRGDWLRELKHPAKAEESVYSFCDFWWIVAPAECIKDGELPPTWGLLDLRANGLVQKVAAPRLEAKPITREFFASLMRRGVQGINETALRMQRQHIDDATAKIEERIQFEVGRRARRFDELTEKVKEFEAATGLNFNDWLAPPGDVIALARRLHRLKNHGNSEPFGKLIDLADTLVKAGGQIRDAIGATGLPEPQPGGAE
ncbi:MAG TPA: hypothetical protein PLR28_10610 [Dokdonella sp.]|nr:hypothetical protein [Dokdonella sp.]